MLPREVDALDRVAVRAAAAPVQELQRHDLHPLAYPHHADPVVPARADRPGDVRAVTVLVQRLGVAADEVPAVDVVDEPIAVVVAAVAADLESIAPEVRRQVGMAQVDPRIDDRDRDGVGVGRDLPGV